MDVEITLVAADVGAGKLHRLSLGVVADALEGEDAPVGVHVQQPCLSRVQPGDGEALLPAGDPNAIEGVYLVEGEDVQIHVGQVGDQVLGDVGLLQGEGLPVQQVEPLDVAEGLLRRSAQAVGGQVERVPADP